MAAREDQAQSVVADGHVRVAPSALRRLDAGELRLDRRVACQFTGLLPQPTASAQPVDGPVPRGRRDPGARVVRYTPNRPCLERGDERFLDGLLGEVEVAEDADERRDRAARFGAKQAVDDLVRGRVGGRQSAPTASGTD
jgi:hypothetical protein